MGVIPSAGDIKVAPSGEVYAVGTQGGSTVPRQWVVRRSLQHGDAGSWTTVAAIGTVGLSEARAVAFNSAGAVFVVGHVVVAGSKGGISSSVWTVQRSLDKGNTWAPVDSFQDGSGQDAGAEGIAVDSAGKIYVAGFAKAVVKGKTINEWVVRRSTVGGDAGTWVTIDKATSSDGSFLTPTEVACDAGGNVWVCGAVRPSSGPSRWIVRKGTAVNGTISSWSETDNYSGGAGTTGASPNGIAIDAQGSVYGTGIWTDSVENWWTTRKLSP